MLRAQLDYLVCAEICVPETAALALTVPSGPAADSREAAAISEFEARLPTAAAESGLGLVRVGLAGAGKAETLQVTLQSDRPLSTPDAIVEGPAGFAFGKPEVRLSSDRLSAELRIPVLREAAAEGRLEGNRARLTLFDGPRGTEQEVLLLPLPEAAGGVGRLLPILLVALLGGLILNLMPCVLPVLSLKLLSAVGHGGREKRQVRLAFLASAAGILASFLLLATAAILVKSAGVAVGWGMQFQQPLFLLAMALLLTLFASNLFGWFEIHLPGGLAGPLAATGGKGLPGHFLTGAFATLLATPCSAPFLGTAVGFALAAGPPEILAVFSALGLGLALPYLLVAALPGLAASLPRPGPWMVTLRRLLGLALALTALWLLTVLATTLGSAPAALAGAVLLVLAAVLALGGRRGRGWRALPAAVTAAALLALGLLAPSPPALQQDEYLAAGWEPLGTGEISRAVAAGKVVFVDVTADWCITCQVNKSLVLERGEVAKRLAAEGILRLRGDWTRPDPAIAAYLASFGRYGIPFNAVYGPAAPQGIALPELLTEGAVLEALARAAGSPQLAAGR